MRGANKHIKNPRKEREVRTRDSTSTVLARKFPEAFNEIQVW